MRHSPDGLPTSELCWKHGLSHATFYKHKAKYGGRRPPSVAHGLDLGKVCKLN